VFYDTIYNTGIVLNIFVLAVFIFWATILTKYVFANTTTQSEKKLNPHANTPAAVQMIEINRKYENTRQFNLLTKPPNSFGIFQPLSDITNRNTTTVPAEENSSKRPIVFNNLQVTNNKYVFANTTTQSEKKLNPHANTPAAVQMIEINRKYENTRQIHRLLTNQKLDRQIHSEYFNHCLTLQIEILPLYLLKRTVQSV
jgi:hypothetical protein